MQKTLFIFILLLFFRNCFAQYDAECFLTNREFAKNEIKNLSNNLLYDTVSFDDTVMTSAGKRFRDTVLAMRKPVDISSFVNKLVGCKMPDFSFFNIAKEEMSVYKIQSDFTILTFGSVSYGDVSNARLHQFSKLKTTLKDSLTVINIYDDADDKVIEYARDFENNVEYVANADLLIYNYTFGNGPITYVLDKYKNIIFIKSGHEYRYTPDEIYVEILEKIRATKCSN
jgi:hypothetical protein